MKAIIPVAGTGVRLRPLTYTQPKPLIPVAGKPIISFIVDQLIELGVEDFVFIIGYLGEKIREYIERTYPKLNTVFVTQEERIGSAHAIWLARDFYADAEEIIIFFGDAIIDADLQLFKDSQVTCLGVKTVDDPRNFGVVEHDIDGNIRLLVEKPRIPKSNLAMVGCYKIREVTQFIEACAYNMENNVRSIGEYPLTDALNRMLEWGTELATITVDNWFDCGRREVLLETNAIFLDRAGFATDEVHIPMYREDIANYLGVALETISRMMTRLSDEGVIEVRHRHIRVIEAGVTALTEHARPPNEAVNGQ
jgi:glucose-1-phosphate thymidylyltransferase